MEKRELHYFWHTSQADSFKMRHISIILFAIACCSMVGNAQDDVLRSALERFGLDSSTVGYRSYPTWDPAGAPDPFRLPAFDALRARPLKIPAFTRGILWNYHLYMKGDSANFPRPLLAQVRPLAGLIFHSGRNLGHNIGRFGFDYSPLVPDDNALIHAIEQVYREAGRDLGNTIVYPLPTQDWTNRHKAFAAVIAALPNELQQSIARIVTAIGEAARWRDRSLADVFQ